MGIRNQVEQFSNDARNRKYLHRACRENAPGGNRSEDSGILLGIYSQDPETFAQHRAKGNFQ